MISKLISDIRDKKERIEYRFQELSKNYTEIGVMHRSDGALVIFAVYIALTKGDQREESRVRSILHGRRVD